MALSLTGFPYGSTPATFTSEMPIEMAVSRLQAATGRAIVPRRDGPLFVGTVKEQKVTLRRFVPVGSIGIVSTLAFKGRFVGVQGKTELRGKFTMLLFVKILFSCWFALWGLLTLSGLYFMLIRWEFSPIFLSCPLMFALGMGIVEARKRLDRRDQAHVSDFIQAVLSRRVI